MKRIIKIFAAILLLGIICAACNHYVCPAYSDNSSNQPVELSEGS